MLDGSNLTSGGDRDPLRVAALALARAEKVRLVVFFDGPPPPGSPPIERLGQVEFRYVPNADRAILDALAAGGRGWRLATDDRLLAARARSAGAEVQPAAAFWRKARALSPDAGERPAALEARAELERVRRETERLPKDVPVRVPRRRRQK